MHSTSSLLIIQGTALFKGLAAYFWNIYYAVMSTWEGILRRKTNLIIPTTSYSYFPCSSLLFSSSRVSFLARLISHCMLSTAVSASSGPLCSVPYISSALPRWQIFVPVVQPLISLFYGILATHHYLWPFSGPTFNWQGFHHPHTKALLGLAWWKSLYLICARPWVQFSEPLEISTNSMNTYKCACKNKCFPGQ